DQLLGAAVEKPDMRIDALDHLAVELQHQAQHAVRRRVLRPEINGEIAQLAFGHPYSPLAIRCPPSIRYSLLATRYSPHSSGRHRRLFGLLRLLPEARMELVPGHDVTLMTALADRVDAVVCLDFESNASAVDHDAFDLDRHGQSRRRGRGMGDVDVHADAPL